MTRRRFPWIGATLLLAACSGGDLSDLEEYARQIKARPPTPIEPLPEIKPVDTFVFEPGNRRDPFVADKSGVEAPAANPGDSLAPDPLRRKEELEGYSLDTLRMVGTLEQNQVRWGLIRTQDGTLHRVRVGNYLGMNNGQITNIGDDAIHLTEVVSDNPGEWRERQATVTLSQ